MRVKMATVMQPKESRFSKFISFSLKNYSEAAQPPRIQLSIPAFHSYLKSQLLVGGLNQTRTLVDPIFSLHKQQESRYEFKMQHKNASLNLSEYPRNSGRTRDLNRASTDQNISPFKPGWVFGRTNDYVHDIRPCNFDNKVGSRAGKSSTYANPGDAGRYVKNGVSRS